MLRAIIVITKLWRARLRPFKVQRENISRRMCPILLLLLFGHNSQATCECDSWIGSQAFIWRTWYRAKWKRKYTSLDTLDLMAHDWHQLFALAQCTRMQFNCISRTYRQTECGRSMRPSTVGSESLPGTACRPNFIASFRDPQTKVLCAWVFTRTNRKRIIFSFCTTSPSQNSRCSIHCFLTYSDLDLLFFSAKPFQRTWTLLWFFFSLPLLRICSRLRGAMFIFSGFAYTENTNRQGTQSTAIIRSVARARN